METPHLRQAHVAKIPQGAQILSDEQALKLQTKFIDGWKPQRETFFLRNSAILSGTAALLASTVITHQYRHVLKLRKHAEITMYLPCIFFPTTMAAILHSKLVTNDIVIMRTPCNLCLDLRSSSVQALAGTLYPVILSSIAGFSFARIYLTYRVPTLLDAAERRTFFKVWFQVTKSFSSKLYLIFIAQILTAVFLTNMQTSEFQSISLKRNSAVEEL